MMGFEHAYGIEGVEIAMDHVTLLKSDGVQRLEVHQVDHIERTGCSITQFRADEPVDLGNGDVLIVAYSIEVTSA